MAFFERGPAQFFGRLHPRRAGFLRMRVKHIRGRGQIDGEVAGALQNQAPAVPAHLAVGVVDQVHEILHPGQAVAVDIFQGTPLRLQGAALFVPAGEAGLAPALQPEAYPGHGRFFLRPEPYGHDLVRVGKEALPANALPRKFQLVQRQSVLQLQRSFAAGFLSLHAHHQPAHGHLGAIVALYAHAVLQQRVGLIIPPLHELFPRLAHGLGRALLKGLALGAARPAGAFRKIKPSP